MDVIDPTFNYVELWWTDSLEKKGYMEEGKGEWASHDDDMVSVQLYSEVPSL